MKLRCNVMVRVVTCFRVHKARTSVLVAIHRLSLRVLELRPQLWNQNEMIWQVRSSWHGDHRLVPHWTPLSVTRLNQHDKFPVSTILAVCCEIPLQHNVNTILAVCCAFSLQLCWLSCLPARRRCNNTLYNNHDEMTDYAWWLLCGKAVDPKNP